jgi:putative DNA primase/helicase
MYEDGTYIPCKNKLGAIVRNLVQGIKKNQLAEVTSYINDMSPFKHKVADPKYIAFKNGIYNIETGELEDFDPSIIITNKIPHNYNYDAYNETMDIMLDKVSCNDDQIRDLLEEMAGFCLHRSNGLRKSFILIGDKANGKSTFLDCLVNMVGEDNTSALDLSELKDRFRASEMVGKLLNAGDDINDNFINDASGFKKLVSGERTTFEKKGVDAFKFSNYCKFIFSANSIPRMKDKTGAVLDRLIIIPFNASFSKKDPDYDPHIKSKLSTEEAMEYLLQLALDGLKRVLKHNGFSESQKVQEELEKYHEKNDPLIGFMKELDMDVDVYNQPSKDVYTRYKIYCNDNNLTALAHNAFSENLSRNYGLSTKTAKVNGKSVKVFRGCEE